VEDKVVLRLVRGDGVELRCNMRRGASMGRVRRSYGQTMGVSIEGIAMAIGGRTINDDDTAASLGLADGDMVEVKEEKGEEEKAVAEKKDAKTFHSLNGKKFNSLKALNHFLSATKMRREKVSLEDRKRWSLGLLTDHALKRRKKHMKKNKENLRRKTLFQNAVKVKRSKTKEIEDKYFRTPLQSINTKMTRRQMHDMRTRTRG